MSLLTKHPLLILGVGFTVGFQVHKHRKKIIEAAAAGAEKAKAAVARHTEHLEDVVAAKHH